MKKIFYRIRQALKRKMLTFINDYFLPPKTVKEGKTKSGIVALLCHRDIDLFIFSLTSFFYFTEENLSIQIINDGSLTNKDIKRLKRHFSIEVISVETIRKKVSKLINKYPNYYKIACHPKTAIYIHKINALLFSPFEKTILVDPDIITTKSPTNIKKWIDASTDNILYTAHKESFFQKSHYPEYALRKLLFRYLKTTMTGGFSSGLIAVPFHPSLLLNDIENICTLLIEISSNYSDNIDEVILACILSKKKSAIRLPENKYYIMAFKGQYKLSKTKKASMIHFGHLTTPKFYPHAFLTAFANNFFVK